MKTVKILISLLAACCAASGFYQTPASAAITLTSVAAVSFQSVA